MIESLSSERNKKQKPQLSTEERQYNHNESERRRQQSINCAIERLKELVPGCKEHRISKATILARSATYIEITKNQMASLKQENIKLKDIISGKTAPTNPLYHIDVPPAAITTAINPIQPIHSSSPSSSISEVSEEDMFLKNDKHHRETEQFIHEFHPDAVNIMMPHGVQYPSQNTGDHAQDAFLILFMAGSFYVLFLDGSVLNHIDSISKNGRSLMSYHVIDSEIDITYYVIFVTKVVLLYLIYSLVSSYRKLALFKKNNDLESARKHRFLGEVSLCAGNYQTSEEHFVKSLTLFGSSIGHVPKSTETNSIEYYLMIEQITHVFHFFFPIKYLTGLYLNFHGVAANAREAKLSLIGLFNAKQARELPLDSHSCLILLKAINLAEALDPQSQRIASIYTIWGGVLSQEEGLEDLANYYYKKALKIADQHGPFVTAHVNAIWETAKKREKAPPSFHIYIAGRVIQSLLRLTCSI